MAFAIIFIAAGGVMVASAFTGQSIADTFRNFAGGLNPAGGRGGSTGNASNVSTSPGTPAGAIPGLGAFPTGKTAGYKGPNATVLEQLHSVATGKFNLKLNNLCRSAADNARVGGSPTSFHMACRAGDYTGSVNDRVAFARYAKPILDPIPGSEVCCDQAGMFECAPYDHSDHVHIGA